MLTLFNVVTIIFATVICMMPLKRLIRGTSNVLMICALSFYVMHVLPMLVEMLIGIEGIRLIYPKMYDAMKDVPTCIVYNLFVLFSESALIILSLSIPYKRHDIRKLSVAIQKFAGSRIAIVLLYLAILSPVIAALFSPKPKIYLEYAYFFTHSYSSTGELYQFHELVMSSVLWVAWFASIVLYLIKRSRNKHALSIYFSIAMITWISGKRTLLVFALVGILFCDFVTGQKKKGRLLLKSVVFLLIIVAYFIIYTLVTRKMISYGTDVLYSVYFARMSNVKVAIYALLRGDQIFDYPCQSVVYDLLCWIPRSIWKTKPDLYCHYFSAYVMGHTSIKSNTFVFQINIWTEFISNFGFFGPLITVVALYYASKLTEDTRSIFAYVFGFIFLVLYTMYGFESINRYIGIAWVVTLFSSYFKFTLRRRR